MKEIIQVAKGQTATYALCADGSVWVGGEGVWLPYGGPFPQYLTMMADPNPKTDGKPDE